MKVSGGMIQDAIVGGNPLILNDEGKLRGQATVAFNFQHGNGLTWFLLGEVRGGQDLFGAGGKAGVRFAW